MYPLLSKAAIKAVHAAVEDMFARAKARLLGRKWQPRVIRFEWQPVGHREDLSLPGIFNAASQAEGFKPNEDLRATLEKAAEQYMDAHQELAKARIVNAVQSTLNEVKSKKLKEGAFENALGAELAQIMQKTTAAVKTIVETEATATRNTGALDGISKIAASLNQDDPLVYFVVVHDNLLCLEESEEVFLPGGKRTVRVGDLKVGDFLALPTIPNQKMNRNEVTAISKKKAEVIRLTFDNGRELVCTEDHPLLVRCNGVLVFVEAGELEDRHEVVFIEDLDSNGKRKEASYAINARPFMCRLGYPSAYSFWKSEKDRILELALGPGGRRAVLAKYGISVREWDSFVRPVMEAYFPGKVRLAGGVPNNHFNGPYLEQRAKGYVTRYESLGGDCWLANMIRSGERTKDIGRRYEIGYRFLNERVAALDLMSVIKGRGSRANWAKNRKLLLRKARERGTPHFWAISKPEQAFADKVRSLGFTVKQGQQISNMKVDLLLDDYKVVIEYDGSGHDIRDRLKKGGGAGRLTAQIDFYRDAVLKRMGYRVLRVKAPKDTCPDDCFPLFDFVNSERTFAVWHV